MSFRRVGGLAATVTSILLWAACGQVYRPVVIPCSLGGIPGCPPQVNPTPGNFHTVFAISTNEPNYPGGAMQVDVSGDSILGETPTNDISKPNLGTNPTHGAISPSNSRVFVASAGSVLPGGVDVVSYFTPAFQSTQATGLGVVSTIPLPTGAQPVFVNATQNTAVFVANYGNNTVSAINTTSNLVSNTATVGANPVSLAETPNGLKLYVANQGSNSVSSLNVTDLSPNTVTGFTGITPVWVTARADSQKVYVLTQGDGQLVTIDTATDTVSSSLPVGAGANYISYDSHLNRLYVTNPVTATVYVFSGTGGVGDTPTQLAAISMTAGTNPPCPDGCSPVSVAALHDGSRFYVASYQTATTCPDPTVTGACVIPGLTVFNANSLTAKITPALKLLVWPASPNSDWPFVTNQYAVPPLTSCVTAPVYSPSSTRFRVFATASPDSSRVYVSMCDAGAIAVVNTTDSNVNNSGAAADTLITDLLEAYEPPQTDGQRSPQNPIFLFPGQ